MDLVRALEVFKLNQLCSGWVDSIWDLEFTEAEPLDSAVEDEITASGHKAFRKLYDCLLPYATDTEASSTGDDASPQSIWTLFGENGVSTRSLLAVLSYFILEGKAKTANVQQRRNALHAAALYLLLLGVTGSVANKVFHQVLFDTCLDTISHCWPQSSGKRKKDTVKSSQAEGKRSKPHRKDNEEMEVEDAEEEEQEEMNFSSQDLVKIRDGVVLLVRTLLQLLQKFSLKDKPQSADNCAQAFIKLIYFEPVSRDFTYTVGRDVNAMKTVPELAFFGLWLLCYSSNHRDAEESLRRVLSRLVYVIVMMSKGNRGSHTLLMRTQVVLTARDQAIHFVCQIVEELKEPALPFLRTLLQHICFTMVEKCEYRTHGAQAMSVLLSKMPCSDYASFIKWFNDYSHHTKMVFRMFALDVVLALLEQPERKPDESVSPELVPFLQHNILIQKVLFGRWDDVAPTVRGHALACIAQLLEISSLNATHSIHDLFSSMRAQTMFGANGSEGTLNPHQTQKTYRTLAFNTVEVISTDNTSHWRSNTHPELEDRLAALMRRIRDPKTNVRKHALQALMGFLKHNLIPMSPENLAVMSERSRDPAVSVKKKALECLGDLLKAKPENSLVQKAWLQGVVPAVIDTTTSVQEKALECLEEVLLKQVKKYTARGYMDAAQKLAWDLLGLLCHECQDLSRYFSRAFTPWSKQNKFTATFVSNLVSHMEAEHAAGAWLLLSKVASCSPKLDYGKILHAWDDMIRLNSVNVTTSCHILCVMGDIAEHLNEDTKARVVDDIMKWLKSFSLPLEVVSASVETLCRLGRSPDMKQTQAFLNQHCGELVSVCEVYLSSIILCENGAQNLNEELMVKHLHTLGVASLHCPAKVSKRTVLLIQVVLTSGFAAHLGSEELPASQPLSQFKSNSMPSTVLAHAVNTLGKLCLQHEDVTKRFLPALARELELGSEVAVRNNVVVIMCDLCVRYTNMVDRYIPNISACLRDDEPIIRKQTLIMLSNLLQEEYIKWKGSLFFRFVAALVDPDPAIVSLCEYCLVEILLKKNPVMFSQHFIEAIFHFNSYYKHNSYNRFPQTNREKTRFSLKGTQNCEKRFRIYRFFLEHFTDTQRFNITSKISQSILACFADDELPLDSDGADILAETFSILSLKEMKLQAMMGQAAGEEDQDEENIAAAMAKVVLQEAQRKVVSQVQKKAFIENTIPIIIVLKSKLEKKRSPVVKDLMGYLQVTMQDYRCEVKEFFAADEQLAAELEYDLKMYEKEKEKEDMEKQAMCNSSAVATPTTAPGSVQDSPARALAARSLQVGFTTPHAPGPRGLLTPRLVQSARNPGRFLPKLVPAASQRRSCGDGDRPSTILEGSVVPKKRPIPHRAISTPHPDLGANVTFGDGVSAIFGDSGTSPMESEEGSVLHLIDPTHPGQTPRQWNLQSPLRQKKTRPKQQ